MEISYLFTRLCHWLCYWEQSPGQWVSPWLVQSHTFWKELRNSSKLCKAKFINFRNKKNRDVCGTISTWHSLAHWGNWQKTHGVAAWWKVGDCSILTGLIEWILSTYTDLLPFDDFVLEKKNSACCLLKTKYLLSWWKEVLKLNIVIWRENLCASENANCHQPLYFRRQPVEFFFTKKFVKCRSVQDPLNQSS